MTIKAEKFPLAENAGIFVYFSDFLCRTQSSQTRSCRCCIIAMWELILSIIFFDELHFFLLIAEKSAN